MWHIKSIKKQLDKDLQEVLTEGDVSQSKLDKQLLNILVSSYETSRKSVKNLIDSDGISRARTLQEMATQLEFLAKIVTAERELTDQFINDLKKLGE